MPVSLTRATAADRVTLDNLMQLYVYDWSELQRTAGFTDVGDDGRFQAYPLDPYFRDADRHPFLLRDGPLVGFALVRETAPLAGDGQVFDMAEFFVLRAHRRRGVGHDAAAQLFRLFPGEWQVRQRAGNDAARSFWRRVIGHVTEGRFDDTTWDDARWNGTVQRFASAR